MSLGWARFCRICVDLAEYIALQGTRPRYCSCHQQQILKLHDPHTHSIHAVVEYEEGSEMATLHPVFSLCHDNQTWGEGGKVQALRRQLVCRVGRIIIRHPRRSLQFRSSDLSPASCCCCLCRPGSQPSRGEMWLELDIYIYYIL